MPAGSLPKWDLMKGPLRPSAILYSYRDMIAGHFIYLSVFVQLASVPFLGGRGSCAFKVGTGQIDRHENYRPYSSFPASR